MVITLLVQPSGNHSGFLTPTIENLRSLSPDPNPPANFQELLIALQGLGEVCALYVLYINNTLVCSLFSRLSVYVRLVCLYNINICTSSYMVSHAEDFTGIELHGTAQLTV